MRAKDIEMPTTEEVPMPQVMIDDLKRRGLNPDDYGCIAIKARIHGGPFAFMGPTPEQIETWRAKAEADIRQKVGDHFYEVVVMPLLQEGE